MKTEFRPAPCAHDICQYPAIVRHQLKTGMANLCRNHYDMHTLQEAKDYCREQGLDTPEKLRQFCRDGFKRLASGQRNSPMDHWRNVLKTPGLPMATYDAAREVLGAKLVVREPGQDDEEMEAA